MNDLVISNLRKIPALSQFTDVQIETLLKIVDSDVVDYEVNQTIIREGDFNNNIYIVMKGKLGNFMNKQLTNTDIEPSVYEFVPGDVVGETNLKNAMAPQHVGTIRTLEKTTLFKIHRWLLKNYLIQFREIYTHTSLKKRPSESFVIL